MCVDGGSYGDGKFKSKCPFVLEIWQVREAVGRFSRTACNHAYPQKAIGFLGGAKCVF